MSFPGRALIGATAAVGFSALVLPSVHSYPTVLSLLIALCAWGVVASIKSTQFADGHFRVIWTVAIMLHMIVFLIPGLAAWFGLRNRKPGLCSALVCAWCLGYLVLLYVLFPAPMGP
jgi:ABC-type uncharacterized transport system permease subunit